MSSENQHQNPHARHALVRKRETGTFATHVVLRKVLVADILPLKELLEAVIDWSVFPDLEQYMVNRDAKSSASVHLSCSIGELRAMWRRKG